DMHRFSRGAPVAIVMALSVHVQAALLNGGAGLTKYFPDFFSSLATIKYNSSTSTLTVTAIPTSFDVDGPGVGIGGASPVYPSIANTTSLGNKQLSLTMTVNPATGQSTGGTLSLKGKIAALGVDGVLLTATIGTAADDFGWVTGGGTIFEWRYVVTGGLMAGYF